MTSYRNIIVWGLAAFLLSHSLQADRNWTESYKKASRLQGEEACAIYTKLAKQKSVAIADLAVLQRERVCSSNDMDQVQEILKSNKTWSHDLAREVLFEIASRTDNHEVLIQVTPKLIQQNKSQKDQEEILKQAIQSAEEVQSPKLQSLKELLYKVSPRMNPQPQDEDLEAVAKDWKKNREYQKASDVFLEIFAQATSWQEQLEALDESRKSIKEKFRTGQGPRSEFLESSQKMGEFAFEKYQNLSGLNLKEKRKLVKAWTQYGRDLWSYKTSQEEAEQGVRSVVAQFLALEGNSKFLEAEVHYLLARVSENYLKKEQSIQESDQGLSIMDAQENRGAWTSWQKEVYDGLLWKNAFLTRKTGDLEGSLVKMKKAQERSFAKSSRRRALFWQARTEKQLGQEAASTKTYKKLIQQYPYHYYSLWARYDAGIQLQPLASYDNSNPRRPSRVSRHADQVIKLLVEAGELKLAKKYLDGFISPRSQKMEDLFYRSFVGDHFTVLMSFFRMGSKQQKLMQDKYASLIFPTPHKNLVDEQTERYSTLDSHYVYSIMRQESGFNPFSHSWADARGLLQLVPRVARVEKEKAGVDYQHVDDLFLPEVNLPIGVAAFDTAFGKNHNNFIMTTMSYNAGEHRTHPWWERIYKGNLFEFLEEVPFSETRLYVRLVARNYVMFKRLEATAPFDVPPHLFEFFAKPAGE